VDYLKLTYPVGYTNKENVDNYLSRGQNEILKIPQIVIIDRAGMIRAQSGGRNADPRLEDENSLRILLDGLLKEKPPADSRANPAPPVPMSKTR
jgi:hypothetical protein